MIAGLVALILLALGGDPPAQPHWTVNLDQKYGYESFDRGFSRNWYSQQGVVFLSDDKLAVFQIIQTPRITLGRRNATGGAGNFVLQIEVLDTADGHELKSLRLPTSGLIGQLVPTHDGMFLVRAGDILYLYSQDFREVASKSLPLDPGQPQRWEIKTSPSGKAVFAAREYLSGLLWENNKDKPATVELLNADTLGVINTFTVQRLLGWSADEDVILCWDPVLNRGFGLLDSEGKWTQIERSVYEDRLGRASAVQVLSHGRLGIFGLSDLSVVVPPKQEVFSRFKGGRYFSVIKNSDDFLATLIFDGFPRYADGKLTGVTSAQIELYDLRVKRKLIELPIPELIPGFSVSAKGDLAVVHGNKLEVFENRALQ